MSIHNHEVSESSSKKLFSRNETAKILGVSSGTLAVWTSSKRYNLTYTKIGRLVKYDLDDILKFVESRKKSGIDDSCTELVNQKDFTRKGKSCDKENLAKNDLSSQVEIKLEKSQNVNSEGSLFEGFNS